jgi:hypothetical protein
MPSQRRDRPLWLIPVVLLFVILPIGLAVFTAVSSSDTATEGSSRPRLLRTGSRLLQAKPPGPLAIGEEPASYSLTYRIERYDKTKIQVTEETTEVRRPFDARVTTRVDGKVVATRTSRFGTLVIGTGQGPRGLVSPPAPATSDLRMKMTLADAVAAGHLRLAERRRVLGHECQAYRSGSTIGAGELVPVNTRAGESAEFCVDGEGLVLEEVWFKEGRALQRRVATDRQVGVDLADSRFEQPDEAELSVDQGNGIFRSIEPSSGFEGTSYRLAADPPGFTYIGRFVVQPPNLQTFSDPTGQRDSSPRQVSVIDAWERGADMITLAQTIVADPSVVTDAGPTAIPVDLGLGGLQGAAILDLRANEVRLALPEDRYLRVSGTLTRADLIAVAKTLRAETGTGIKVLEP